MVKFDFWKSKTIWGAGLLGVTLILQNLGLVPDHVATDILKTLFGFLGIVGVRDALTK